MTEIDGFFFYCITNVKNRKIYVGVTNDPKERWETHQNIAEGGKETYPNHFSAVHGAITKYGVENFTYEVCKVFSDEDEAYFYEEDFISYIKELKIPHYNIAGGGKGTGSGPNHPRYGKKATPEELLLISARWKEISNRPEVKEANRQRMIERNWVGENHPMFGKKHTKETRTKISEAGIGRVLSDDHRRKIGEALTGRTLSKDTRNKLSDIMKEKNWVGENNPNYDNHWTDEKKKALSDKRVGVPSTKRNLTEAQIIEMFTLRKNSISYAKIAKTFDTTKSVVMSIIKGQSYQDVIRKLIDTGIILKSDIAISIKQSKLSDDDVLEIVRLHKNEGVKINELATKYNVSYGTIYGIVIGTLHTKITRKVI